MREACILLPGRGFPATRLRILALHIGGASQQDGLDLERGQLRMLGADQGNDPGDMRRGKAIAGAIHILLVIPGDIDVDPRCAEFDRRRGIVIIGEGIMAIMRCH